MQDEDERDQAARAARVMNLAGRARWALHHAATIAPDAETRALLAQAEVACLAALARQEAWRAAADGGPPYGGGGVDSTR